MFPLMIPVNFKVVSLGLKPPINFFCSCQMANSKHEPNRQKRVAPSHTTLLLLLLLLPLPATRREAGREREQIEQRESGRRGGREVELNLHQKPLLIYSHPNTRQLISHLQISLAKHQVVLWGKGCNHLLVVATSDNEYLKQRMTKRDICKSKYKREHRKRRKTVSSVAFFPFEVCSNGKRKKNILCLHSIMAVQAVITPGIVWVPHNIQRLVVC